MTPLGVSGANENSTLVGTLLYWLDQRMLWSSRSRTSNSRKTAHFTNNSSQTGEHAFNFCCRQLIIWSRRNMNSYTHARMMTYQLVNVYLHTEKTLCFAKGLPASFLRTEWMTNIATAEAVSKCHSYGCCEQVRVQKCQ